MLLYLELQTCCIVRFYISVAVSSIILLNGLLVVCVVLGFFVMLFIFSIFFFFCKQKTAYEVRISDWSQDVCASDLSTVAMLQYTGGTTGTPKGAMLTHNNITVNARQILGIDPWLDQDDRILGVIPFFHIFANMTVLHRTVLRGGEIIMLQDRQRVV